MGIAAPPIFSSNSSSNKSHSPHHPGLIQGITASSTNKSMSQDFHHHSIFSFPTGQDDDHQHIAQQIRRDKLRLQGFETPQAPQEQPPPTLVGIEEEPPVYEATGMLSEMFNFPSGGGVATATELLDHHQPTAMSFRAATTPRPPPSAGISGEWYGSKTHQSMNADSMQLFLMNPQTRSPSPPPSSTSTLHMLLPNPNPNNPSTSIQGFNISAAVMPPAPQFAYGATPHTEIRGFVEGQGLSLSLSSSLQHLEAAKVEELRNMGPEHSMLFYDNQAAAATATAGPYKGNLGPTHPVHVGYGSSLGVVNVLRNSKYLKAAQELLEEFCSVGKGQFKKSKLGGRSSNPNNSNTNLSSSGTNNNNGGASSSSTSKETPPLSTADRMEHQRRKVKLLSMLDEVDRRYKHYCEQMQMVVNSFDLVMGFGAAVPYTALAQKAMSRHFRCLKDAIAAQLKHSCELLGEKDGAGTSGITKGETPRLKLLDQSLRQQRAFHQMGMMEQEAWRPQRGLPERSVNILRAWLFEHFLHPYPSDADKHLLARQTGLSRNQVSNWFINARVRLWKPMVEEMYQQEAKDEDEEEEDNSNSNNDNQQEREITRNPNNSSNNNNSCSSPTAHAQTPTPPTPSAKRSHINASESDPSFFSETQAPLSSPASEAAPPALIPQSLPQASVIDPNGLQHQRLQRMPTALDMAPATLIRFGAAPGDVSLTLGLRHAGNMPAEKGSFSVTDFGGC